ncbi:hypothetical protein KFL_000370410 [Klebsormidium nitens]|uniref:Uncharacterized protein n=1 Tax=Klebsormidium nitens TaxID=105231 RepID=A0A1Y1HT88_KLENI|nr:hypothetical protein KFL_000370410 [Klebsormidium nitens]|eukprot:GAQ79766.1 hypothetical protein KFL_000370410 [Klebsormidium nitens]
MQSMQSLSFQAIVPLHHRKGKRIPGGTRGHIAGPYVEILQLLQASSSTTWRQHSCGCCRFRGGHFSKDFWGTSAAGATQKGSRMQCAQDAKAAAGAAGTGAQKEVRVLFRMYEEDCRPTNSFMEFGISSDADIRQILDLMQWTDAVDITPGSPAGGRLVQSMADLQPYGWYDRIETYLDLQRVQSHVKTAGHDSSTPIPLDRLLGARFPALTTAPRIFYEDPEQHARWRDAQSALTELARDGGGGTSMEETKSLLAVKDSERALEFDSVAVSEEAATLVVGDFAEVGSVTAVEALREKADRLTERPQLAGGAGKAVVAVLCVKGYDRGSGGKQGLLRYAQQRDVLLAERSRTGVDTMVG